MRRVPPSTARVTTGIIAASTPTVASCGVRNRWRYSKKKSAIRTTMIVAEMLISGAIAWKSQPGFTSASPSDEVHESGHRAVGDAEDDVRVDAEHEDPEEHRRRCEELDLRHVVDVRLRDLLLRLAERVPLVHPQQVARGEHSADRGHDHVDAEGHVRVPAEEPVDERRRAVRGQDRGELA